MKPVLPILALTLAVASCTTPYKSGQTPDDVYYSPGRPEREYVQVDERRDERPQPETREDRYLRLRVRNRDRWSQFDDYYNDPYAYRYSANSEGGSTRGNTRGGGLRSIFNGSSQNSSSSSTPSSSSSSSSSSSGGSSAPRNAPVRRF
ncbi:MAG: hypothetical protein EOO15_19090 [Chitinophagaceae bacterium]|nr:MAG: hypothetical protein EOO15_19090 [Chitinophagaceae bacterium]